MDYITSGFYAFVLNSDLTGYSIVPEMAAAYPVDVTSEYVGSYGITEGETARAWRIALRTDACFDDGTPITADDYIYSMQQQLNPKMLNRRADSWYDGTFSIINAKNYLYAGGPTYDAYTGSEAADTLYVDMWNFWGLEGAVDAEGNACAQYVSISDETLYRDAAVAEGEDEAWVSGKYLWDTYLTEGAKYAAYATSYVYSLSQALIYNLIDGTEEEGTVIYIDMWNFWGLEGAVDAEGNTCPQYVSISDETLYRDAAVAEGEDEAWVSSKYLWESYLTDGAKYAAYATSYCYKAEPAPSVTWEDVGLKKIDDYTIDFVLDYPVNEPAFYVPYSLAGNFLVEKSVYEACKTFYDASGAEVDNEEDAATVTTKYCRSLENTVSFGPYMLTSFELDKEYTLSRNEAWYGYSDGKHLGMYQTDTINVSVIAEHATAMLAFEKGEIDGVSLQSEDMDKYASSSYIVYTPQTYTTKLTFNTDVEKLTERGTNSQVLANKSFREGFAFAIDRMTFTTSYTAAHKPGYGMLNNLYCYDPFTGGLYRDNDSAKAALCHVYGVTYGEGGEYDTLDEAYAAITGYDMEKANKLLAEAYDECVAEGLYDGESEIKLNFRVYNSDTIYVQMFTFFDTSLQTAAKGTGFEGKLSLEMTVDADYDKTMNSGGADIIFSTWGGAQMSPFTMLYQCYCDAADGSGNQNEYGFHTENVSVTFNVDGVEYENSLQNWANWCNNATIEGISDVIGNFADFDYATKCAFFAGCEETYLSAFVNTPIYYRNVASLNGQKINHASSSYLPIVGFGGIDSITYNYNDAEWSEYINNNTLQY